MKPLLAALILALAPAAAIAESPAPAPVGPRPVVSEIISANPASARSFPGVIEGKNATTLGFLTAGRLASVDVSAGDRVAQGDTLATLDQVTLEQDVAAARAALAAAEAKATLAAQQYARAETLRQRGVASDVALSDAEAHRDATAAQAESARADLSRAEDAARYGTLTAPQDALVLDVLVKPGATVSSGRPVIELADRVGREAVIDVPEDFAALLPAEPTFGLRHHGQTGAPVTAVLTWVEPVSETSLGTRRLRLTITDPPEEFRIGTLVEASYMADAAPLLTVPRVAVADGPAVRRVEGTSRTVHRIPVTLGTEVGDRVVVTGGIGLGDEIVTRGVRSLSEGQTVGDRLK